MPMQIPDAIIRAQLHTDIATAWNDSKTTQDDRPIVPAKISDLPRTFIMLSNELRPQRNVGTAGIGEVSIPHLYTITRQSLWPLTGTIEAEKVLQTNALLALLTASTSYAGYRRNVQAIRLEEYTIANEEAVYELSIDFSVEVVTGA